MSFAKQKGRAGEREMADWATNIAGVRYVRTPSSGGMHLDWPFDLMKKTHDVAMFDGIGIEVKNTVQLRHQEWIEQIREACEDAGYTYDPKWFIAFKHKGKWHFTLSKSYFEHLLKNQWKESSREGA